MQASCSLQSELAERRVSFTLKDIDELEVEVVQSLAKWKRMALGKYGIEPGHGIYTDRIAMGNATDDVKSRAFLITRNCKDDGVAYAIRHLL